MNIDFDPPYFVHPQYFTTCLRHPGNKEKRIEIYQFHRYNDQTYASMSDARRLFVTPAGWASFSLKTLSTTDSSVEVVLIPQNAHQSLTTTPAASTSEPRLTVPACGEDCRLNLAGKLKNLEMTRHVQLVESVAATPARPALWWVP